MASIRERTTKAGKTYFTVTWYDREAKRNLSRTYHERGKASTLRDYLDANSNTLSLAVAAKRRIDDTELTVWGAVQDHLDRLRGITEGTLGTYRRNMAHHLENTELAGMPVESVAPADVEQWVDGITAKGGKPASWKTKANQHAVVSAAFGRLANDAKSPVTINPCRGILEANDGLNGREPVYLSKDDLRAIRQRIHEAYQLLTWTLAASGLRFSEATALRRRDLRALSGGRIALQVTRAWQKSSSGHVIIGPPKHHSARTVSVNLELSAALKTRVAEIGPDELVFTNTRGGRIDSSKFHETAWAPLMSELLEDGTLMSRPVPHELRHAHCTHLLQDGRPVHVVQKRLGHKDPQTTLRVYARTTQSDDLEAADAVDW